MALGFIKKVFSFGEGRRSALSSCAARRSRCRRTDPAPSRSRPVARRAPHVAAGRATSLRRGTRRRRPSDPREVVDGRRHAERRRRRRDRPGPSRACRRARPPEPICAERPPRRHRRPARSPSPSRSSRRPSRSAAARAPKPAGSSGCATGLSRSSRELSGNIAGVFTKRKLDEDTLEELEDVLIRADLGMETALRVTDALSRQPLRPATSSDDEVRAVLAAEVEKVLAPVAHAARARPVAQAACHPRRRRQRHRQDHDHRQARRQAPRRRADGDARRRRHVPRRGDRAAEDLGRAHRRRRSSPSKLGADAAGLAFDAFEKAQGRGLRRADHRHRRPAAEQGRADGRARKDRPRARQARSRTRRTPCC